MSRKIKFLRGVLPAVLFVLGICAADAGGQMRVQAAAGQEAQTESVQPERTMNLQEMLRANSLNMQTENGQKFQMKTGDSGPGAVGLPKFGESGESGDSETDRLEKLDFYTSMNTASSELPKEIQKAADAAGILILVERESGEIAAMLNTFAVKSSGNTWIATQEVAGSLDYEQAGMLCMMDSDIVFETIAQNVGSNAALLYAAEPVSVKGVSLGNGIDQDHSLLGVIASWDGETMQRGLLSIENYSYDQGVYTLSDDLQLGNLWTGTMILDAQTYEAVGVGFFTGEQYLFFDIAGIDLPEQLAVKNWGKEISEGGQGNQNGGQQETEWKGLIGRSDLYIIGGIVIVILILAVISVVNRGKKTGQAGGNSGAQPGNPPIQPYGDQRMQEGSPPAQPYRGQVQPMGNPSVQPYGGQGPQVGTPPVQPYGNQAKQAGSPQEHPVQSGKPQKQFRLQGISGAFAGRRFAVAGKLLLGRDKEKCGIAFPSDTAGISREHCTLEVRDGAVFLKDCGSKYGTFFENGLRLEPKVEYYMEPGTRFYLATKTNMFQIIQKKQGG